MLLFIVLHTQSEMGANDITVESHRFGHTFVDLDSQFSHCHPKKGTFTVSTFNFGVIKCPLHTAGNWYFII